MSLPSADRERNHSTNQDSDWRLYDINSWTVVTKTDNESSVVGMSALKAFSFFLIAEFPEFPLSPVCHSLSYVSQGTSVYATEECGMAITKNIRVNRKSLEVREAKQGKVPKRGNK